MLRMNKICFASVLLTAALVSAEVTVKFSNSTLPPNTTNELGALTLTFIVDNSGNVTMDAEAATQIPMIQDAVNAWDGPVGTISYSGAFNTTFSLDLNQLGGSGFRLTNLDGGGLGVAGKSAWRIDRPGLEYIVVSANLTAGMVNLRSVSWGYCTNKLATMMITVPSGFSMNMFLYGPSGLSTNSYGSCDVSKRNLRLSDFESMKFGNVDPGPDEVGYSLTGFTFDVIEEVKSVPFTVGFVTENESENDS